MGTPFGLLVATRPKRAGKSAKRSRGKKKPLAKAPEMGDSRICEIREFPHYRYQGPPFRRVLLFQGLETPLLTTAERIAPQLASLPQNLAIVEIETATGRIERK
jgi:hypothetical protein